MWGVKRKEFNFKEIERKLNNNKKTSFQTTGQTKWFTTGLASVSLKY